MTTLFMPVYELFILRRRNLIMLVKFG